MITILIGIVFGLLGYFAPWFISGMEEAKTSFMASLYGSILPLLVIFGFSFFLCLFDDWIEFKHKRYLKKKANNQARRGKCE